MTNETVQVRIFKCDPKKTPLPGAVFGLFVKGELKMTAVSGDDGFVVFEGIPFQNRSLRSARSRLRKDIRFPAKQLF